MNDRRKGASISGAGVISGGTYDRVSISGAGKITGDIHTEELRISGAGKAKGKVEATKIVVSGSVSFADDVIADEIHVSGSAHVDGRIAAKELKSSGSLKVAGDIASDYIKISGSLRAGADVETEIFRAGGGFHIDGLLSADKIEIRIGGRCQAREIGGEQIDIRSQGPHIPLHGALHRNITTNAHHIPSLHAANRNRPANPQASGAQEGQSVHRDEETLLARPQRQPHGKQIPGSPRSLLFGTLEKSKGQSDAAFGCVELQNAGMKDVSVLPLLFLSISPYNREQSQETDYCK